jgi:hypothetical protein
VHGERNEDSVLGHTVLECNYGKKRGCFLRAARKLSGCGCICLEHTSTRNLSRGFHPQGEEVLNIGHFSGSNYTILDRVAPKWSLMSRARNVTTKATGKKVLLR